MKGKKFLLGGKRLLSKRFIIALLSIMTLLGMSPKLTYTVKAAETTYTVYVGGTEMAVGNDGSAIYYKNGDTTASTDEVQGWNAKLFYDTTNNALTLETNNLQVEGIEADDNSYGAGIYTTANLTINLTGENSIKGKPYGVTNDIQGFGNTYGIYADSVTLQGTGSLNVNTGGIKGSSYAIYAVNNININNTHVSATGGEVTYKNSPWNMTSVGIYTDKGSISIINSIVQTTGDLACDSYGIKCGKILSITGQSNVTATSSDTETSGTIENSSYGIYVADKTTIDKSTVMAQSGKANYHIAGLASLHGLTITDSTVTGIASGMQSNPDKDHSGQYVTNPVTRGVIFGITTDYNKIIWGSNLNYSTDIIIKNSTVKGEVIKGNPEAQAFYNFYCYGIRAYDSISITGGDVTGEVVGDETGAGSYGISTDYNLTINGGAKVTAKASDAEVKSCGTSVWKDFSLTGNSSLKTTAGRIINPAFTNSNTLIDKSTIFRSAGLHMTAGSKEDSTTTPNKKDTFTIVNSRLEAKVEDASDITVPDEYKVERSAVFLFDVIDDKFTFTDTNQTNENWYYWTLDANHDSANKHDSNDKQYVYTEDANKQSDYLLIAPQSNQYTVKYDPNGGTGTYPSETVSENETITVKEAPTKEGYEFKGWSDGSKTYQPKDTVTITQDTTFTAIWEKKEDNVKVKYEFGNGQSDVEETVVKGTDITLKEAPTKEGYTFKGWSDGSKTYQPKDTVTITQDTTFTAVWEKEEDTIDVKVKYEFGNGESDVEESFAQGTNITLKEAPTKEGYEFKGWSDGSKTYQPKDTVIITQDTTFTAVWEKKEDNVKVKYEFGNGKSDVEETVVKGTDITLKEAPTKEGYTFKGWSDGSKTYQPKDMVTVSQDTIFTAVWEKVDSGNNSNDNKDNTENGDTGNKENPSTGTKEEPKTEVKENTASTPEVKKSAETKETKNKKTKTGDESKPMLYVELGLMAVVGCAILFLQNKKSKLLDK